jgi:uncharacterized membrane protein YphA (DoxX/SURF4 family)
VVEAVRTAPPARWPRLRPWLGTAARLGLSGVFIAAGASKAGDLAASARAVDAYELTPYQVSAAIGAALPFVELALGTLLLVGLATRLVAAVTGAALLVFIAGIASTWARGLTIDCGCFGEGGQLPAGVAPTYAVEILKDVGLLALAAYLVVYPLTRLSLDARLGTAVPAVAVPAARDGDG